MVNKIKFKDLKKQIVTFTGNTSNVQGSTTNFQSIYNQYMRVGKTLDNLEVVNLLLQAIPIQSTADIILDNPTEFHNLGIAISQVEIKAAKLKRNKTLGSTTPTLDIKSNQTKYDKPSGLKTPHTRAKHAKKITIN